MESRYSNDNCPDNTLFKKVKINKRFTPRELIHYHMNNPDEPIKDEDIENLVLHTRGSIITVNAPVSTIADAADNRMLSDKEIKGAAGNAITTPYNALGNCD